MPDPRRAAGRLGMEVDVRPFDDEVRDGDLLVSTVPAGAADFYAERAWDSRPAPAAVLDVVYAPGPPPSPKLPPSPAPPSPRTSPGDRGWRHPGRRARLTPVGPRRRAGALAGLP